MMVRIILNLLRVVRLFARLNSKCGGHAHGRLPPPLLNPAPSAIAFDIVFREAFREVERVVLNSLLSTRAIGRLNLRDRALEAKAKEFWDIIKIGRTHLMDATPIRLGQEFSGYAQQVGYARERVEKSIERVEKSIEVLREIALGETAVGTGLNRHIDLPKKMLRHLEQRTGIAFTRRKIISKRRAERTQWSK